MSAKSSISSRIDYFLLVMPISGDADALLL